MAGVCLVPGGGQHRPDSFAVRPDWYRACVCVCYRSPWRLISEMTALLKTHTHMHAYFCCVLSSFNLVKLFQPCQEFALEYLIAPAKNIRASPRCGYWTNAGVQWHWGYWRAAQCFSWQACSYYSCRSRYCLYYQLMIWLFSYVIPVQSMEGGVKTAGLWTKSEIVWQHCS